MRSPFSISSDLNSDTLIFMRKTVLIFGASSFLGSNLLESLKKHYRVIGTYKDTPIEHPGILFYKCDGLKKDRVTHLLGLTKPDVTIYASGLSSILACHSNPKLADALNSAALINVCSAAERYGSKFIFVSSSFVLGGENNEYLESDTPFPVTVYGASLASSEFYVQKSCLNYIIFRTAPFFGRSYHPKRRNWIESVERSVLKGLPANVDDQIEHGHMDPRYLAQIIHLAIEKNVTNRLFQISSQDTMSRYEFARKYIKAQGLDENLVVRAQWSFPLDESSARSRGRDYFRYKMSVKNAEEFFQLTMPSAQDLIASKI